MKRRRNAQGKSSKLLERDALVERLKDKVKSAQSTLDQDKDQPICLRILEPHLDDPAGKRFFELYVYKQLSAEHEALVPKRVCTHLDFYEISEEERQTRYTKFDEAYRDVLWKVRQKHKDLHQVVKDALFDEGLYVESFRRLPQLGIWHSQEDDPFELGFKGAATYLTFEVTEMTVPKRPPAWIIEAASVILDELAKQPQTSLELLNKLCSLPVSREWPLRRRGMSRHLFGTSSLVEGQLWKPIVVNYETRQPCPDDAEDAILAYVSTTQAQDLLKSWQKKSRGKR